MVQMEKGVKFESVVISGQFFDIQSDQLFSVCLKTEYTQCSLMKYTEIYCQSYCILDWYFIGRATNNEISIQVLYWRPQ